MISHNGGNGVLEQIGKSLKVKEVVLLVKKITLLYMFLVKMLWLIANGLVSDYLLRQNGSLLLVEEKRIKQSI